MSRYHYFRRIKPETVDRAKEAAVMAQAQKIGMQVPEDWARDRLAIPKAEVDDKGQREAILEPSFDAFAEKLQKTPPTGPFP